MVTKSRTERSINGLAPRAELGDNLRKALHSSSSLALSLSHEKGQSLRARISLTVFKIPKSCVLMQVCLGGCSRLDHDPESISFIESLVMCHEPFTSSASVFTVSRSEMAAHRIVTTILLSLVVSVVYCGTQHDGAYYASGLDVGSFPFLDDNYTLFSSGGSLQGRQVQGCQSDPTSFQCGNSTTCCKQEYPVCVSKAFLQRKQFC